MAKILIIEDEQFIRDIYIRQIQKIGFEIEGYGSGKKGLEALEHGKYDLILLDIMLPDINGLEVLKQIKQDPASSKIPIILLTNLGQDEIIKEGFALGANSYLIKASYTPDQIAQEVKNILGK
jgi:CheY-like chemotaxis protein